MNTAKSKRHYGAAFWAAGMVVGAAIFGASGCGGSSHGSEYPNDFPISTPTVITRATEDTLSDDAKILATREAADAYVSLAVARAFDADLTKIRTAYPAVQNVHARLNYEPKSLIVVVNPAEPWIAKWDASANAPATMTDTPLEDYNRLADYDGAINSLLLDYEATRTTSALDLGGGRYYVLRFASAHNMDAVAAAFAARSPAIISAEPNHLVGDGDNITYSKSGDTKVYVFSQGYGDCPAGCIEHYIHTYTIAPDGSLSEAITGTPPPTAASPQ